MQLVGSRLPALGPHSAATLILYSLWLAGKTQQVRAHLPVLDPYIVLNIISNHTHLVIADFHHHQLLVLLRHAVQGAKHGSSVIGAGGRRRGFREGLRRRLLDDDALPLTAVVLDDGVVARARFALDDRAVPSTHRARDELVESRAEHIAWDLYCTRARVGSGTSMCL